MSETVTNARGRKTSVFDPPVWSSRIDKAGAKSARNKALLLEEKLVLTRRHCALLSRSSRTIASGRRSQRSRLPSDPSAPKWSSSGLASYQEGHARDRRSGEEEEASASDRQSICCRRF